VERHKSELFVWIWQALSNGLLVDPHNEKEIGDALLKLLADRNLWSVCRKNGLKNIHLYSWPEHCRRYLSWVALCRMRHPQWKAESSVETEELIESQSDSLRDVQDISLRLSVDGNTSISNPGDLERLLRSQNSWGKNNGTEDIKTLAEKQRTVGGRVDSMQDEGPEARKSGSYKAMPLKKRRRLVIIAVDGYDLTSNKPSSALMSHIQSIVKTIRSDSSSRVKPGLVISSALTKSEIVEMLNSAGMSPTEFDALVCSSGSEVYYSASGSDDSGTLHDLQADEDYSTHIDYRWGYEGLRKTMARLNKSDAESANNDKILNEDIGRCNSHCLAYTVTNPDIVSSSSLSVPPSLIACGTVKFCCILRNFICEYILPQCLRYNFVVVGPQCGSTASALADARFEVPRDVLPKFNTLARVASFGISVTSSQVCSQSPFGQSLSLSNVQCSQRFMDP
jgi:sucrose-phosphate synthase